MESTSELGHELFSAQPSLELIKRVTRSAHANAIDLQKFTDDVLSHLDKSSPEDLLKVGIGLHIIGRAAEAVEKLQGAKDCQEKYLALGFAQRACGHYDEALASFQKSLSLKADALVVAMETVATLIKAKDLEGAQQALDACSNYDGVSAEYHYHQAQIKEAQGLHGDAVNQLRKALALCPDHAEALFMLALRADLVGNDDEAIGYYGRILPGARVR